MNTRHIATHIVGRTLIADSPLSTFGFQIIFAALLLLQSIAVTQLYAQTEPSWDDQFAAYGVNGEVLAAALTTDGRLYLGGEFSRAGGLAADGIVMWNGSQWVGLGKGLGDGFSGVVYAVAVDSDGTVYIGGDFSEVVQQNGSVVDASNLARWDGSSWEALGTGVDGEVHTLTFDESGTLFIGGAFSRDGSGEFELSKVAAWDGSNLSSIGNGLGTFSGVVVRTFDFDSQGNLYAGGSELAGGVFRWDGQSWQSFGARHQGTINTMQFDSQDNLYIGGDFQTVVQPDDSELLANRIARWNGSTWETVGTGFDAEVKALGFDASGMLHVSGIFSQLGDGTTLRHIARWNANWEPVGPGADENLFEGVNALVFAGPGAFYALGDVQHLGGELVNGVGYWTGQQWQGIGGMGMDGTVRALTFDSSGILYAGGDFEYGGSIKVSGLARWDDNAWEPLAQGFSGGSVNALASAADRVIYAGGDFENIQQNDGSELLTYGISRWSGTAWEAMGTGVNGTVNAIVVDASGNVFIGGDFTQDGSSSVALPYIAMWDGISWSSPGGGMDGVVNALSLNNEGQVVAGGAFTQAGSTGNTAYLAKWNGSAWEELSPTTTLDAAVNALHLDEAGNLFIGGAFTQVESNLGANYLAIWENNAWSLVGAINGNGVSGCCVNAVSQGIGGGVIVAGEFEGVQNPVGPDLQANKIATWGFQTGWRVLEQGVDGDVLALASNGEDIVAGGVFQVAGGMPSAHVARWSANEMLVSVEDDLDIPSTIVTSEIYPNPANGQARLNLEIDKAQSVTVEVFDVLGRKVSTAFNGHLPADRSVTVLLRQESMSAGMYMVRIRGDRFNTTRSLVWF